MTILRALPVIAVATMALVLLAIRFGALTPLAGFGAFILVWLVAAIGGLVIGALVLRGGQHRRLAIADLGIGVVLTVSLLSLGRGTRAPPIHDITTAPEDPPAFVAALSAPENRDRDLGYPNGHPNTAELQRRAYPEIVPIATTADPQAAYQAVLEAAGELGWQVVWASAANGQIEFTDTTGIFRFVDDIAVRVRARNDGAVIDVRSLSRVGRSDLGANAARIRALATALQ